MTGVDWDAGEFYESNPKGPTAVPEKTWYIARCENCVPPRNLPFSVEYDRDEWAEDHVGATGHPVSLSEETTWVVPEEERLWRS